MKRHECLDFQEELISSAEVLSQEAEAHVNRCAECAALRRTSRRFLAGGAAEEPDCRLDDAVLRYASEACRRRRVRTFFWRRIVPVFSAAAAVVALLSVVMLPEDKPAQMPEFLVAAAVNPVLKQEPVAAVLPGSAAEVASAAKVISAPEVSMMDWSAFEGEAFDLNQELTSCQNVLVAGMQI